LGASAALTAGQAPSTTPQGPTFKVQVDYVEVDVVVTNERGEFVRDLTAEDFQVFEDGKPQTISSFALVDIPIERAERPLFADREIEPDVQSNARPFFGRVYVMMLDEAHTDAHNTPLVRRAARKFIEEDLGANDMMAVVFARGLHGGDDYGQEFTSNRRLLLTAVDKFIGKKPRSATLEKLEQYASVAAQRAAGATGVNVSDPLVFEREINARAVLEGLTNVSDWFGSVRGRKKTILYFSQGIDYDFYDVFNNRSASMIQMRMQDLMRSATKSNVSIYAIDPRGLQSLSDGNVELQTPIGNDPSAALLNERGLQEENRLARESLRTIAEETGGFAVVNTNEFANAFDRVVQENSSYYVMAYYPPDPKRDGKYHRINVRVTRPGLTVRARRGYANPTGKAPAPVRGNQSPEILEALSSPLPLSGLTMRVFASPFKGTAPNASVLLGVELRGADLETSADSKLELSFVASDVKGKIGASGNDSMTLNLRPETKARVEETGLRFLRRFEVAPGLYYLRVAAHDLGGGRLGSVLYDLEVPDFYAERLSMSGLVLTSPTASAVPTVRPDEELRQVLPGSPSAQRSFAQGEEIFLYADVYDNDVSAPHRVDITTTVKTDTGRVVFTHEEARSSEDLGGQRGGYGYVVRIPLHDLPPASYVLRVEARSGLQPDTTAAREVLLAVTTPPERP
jgi:VWFA-related protein